MAIKKYKPTTPTRRFTTVSTFEEVTKKQPEKSLLEPLPKKSGRNVNAYDANDAEQAASANTSSH